ncbi:MAG TPA: DUF1641 domain-containing protein [Hanamia sp.]|jgi:uncharacterized protein YjgD (DUF1641 family)|nr:DUF1641 domain-containing protein [Hanamia sp.]
MAKPISMIFEEQKTGEEKNQESIQSLKEHAAENTEALKEAIVLISELQGSGILDAAVSLVKAKEKVAEIAIGQMVRPPVTNMINNAMAAAGALSELDPEFTKKLVNGLNMGIKKADEGLQSNKKASVWDLVKAMKDPDINRTLLFGLNLIKGIGQGLK